MIQQKLFKVRDLRKKDQYKIDDVYLNGYAKFCKPVATAVYNSLCRHAEFNSQKAFPSQDLIAYQHSISVKSVRRAIKKLASYNIIRIEKERKKGKFANYVYTLLDKTEWKSITSGQKRPMVNSPVDKNTIGQKTTMVKSPTKDNKVYKDNKVIYKDNKVIATQSVAGKEIQRISFKKEIDKLIDLFKEVNPAHYRLFGNKTQRKALEDLVKKWGREKVEQTIKLLPQTNQMKYAPTITTPIQLADKLGSLIVFYKKSKIKNKPSIAKIK